MESISLPTKIGIIFDDGFVKSTIKTAEMFERFNLRAVFGVVADPSNFVPGCGDWKLWNELQRRGHIIHPHAQTHVKLSELSPAQAVASVKQCLESFAENLEGFKAEQAVYACAYNTGTPEVIEWLLPRVRCIRIGGDPFLTPSALQSRVWPSATFGPEDPYQDFLNHLEQCRQRRPTALFYCLHGLDGEYWGATQSDHLRRILEIITSDEAFTYWDLS
jgi:hypothetical protein